MAPSPTNEKRRVVRWMTPSPLLAVLVACTPEMNLSDYTGTGGTTEIHESTSNGPPTGQSTSSSTHTSPSSPESDTTSTSEIGASSSGAPATTGGPPSDCPACDGAVAACSSDRGCTAIDACVDDCLADGGDISCFPTCQCAADANGEGLALYNAFLACYAEQCGGPSVCEAEYNTCFEDPEHQECSDIQECVNEMCTCLSGDASLTCWTLCKKGHTAQAIQRFDAFWQCFNENN